MKYQDSSYSQPGVQMGSPAVVASACGLCEIQQRSNCTALNAFLVTCVAGSYEDFSLYR